MTHNILQLINDLDQHLLSVEYKGFDPYDGLSSKYFRYFDNYYICFIISNTLKRLPFNIRPLLKIEKSLNPKALSLFMKSYSILSRILGTNKYDSLLDTMYTDLLRMKLNESNLSWGHQYRVLTRSAFRKEDVPSGVLTVFIGLGFIEYYLYKRDPDILLKLHSIANFILSDLPVTRLKDGICFSYTPVEQDVILNANALYAEFLSKLHSITGKQQYKKVAQECIIFTNYYNKENGEWPYSINKNKHYHQTDYHQGFMIESYLEVINHTDFHDFATKTTLDRAVNFYYNKQFSKDGAAYWRPYKLYPIDIHNQAQGIITFSKLSNKEPKYLNKSLKILNWAIENLYNSKNGFFYYKKYKYFYNKLNYIRWNQAWMLLSLVEIYKNMNKIEPANLKALTRFDIEIK